MTNQAVGEDTNRGHKRFIWTQPQAHNIMKYAPFTINLIFCGIFASCSSIRHSENFLVYYSLKVNYDQIHDYQLGGAEINEPGFLWIDGDTIRWSWRSYSALSEVKEGLPSSEISGMKLSDFYAPFLVKRNRIGYSILYEDNAGSRKESLTFSYNDSIKKDRTPPFNSFSSIDGYTWPIDRNVRIEVLGKSLKCDVFGVSNYYAGLTKTKNDYLIIYLDRKLGIPLIMEYHYPKNYSHYYYQIIADGVEEFKQQYFVED